MTEFFSRDAVPAIESLTTAFDLGKERLSGVSPQTLELFKAVYALAACNSLRKGLIYYSDNKLKLENSRGKAGAAIGIISLLERIITQGVNVNDSKLGNTVCAIDNGNERDIALRQTIYDHLNEDRAVFEEICTKLQGKYGGSFMELLVRPGAPVVLPVVRVDNVAAAQAESSTADAQMSDAARGEPQQAHDDDSESEASNISDEGDPSSDDDNGDDQEESSDDEGGDERPAKRGAAQEAEEPKKQENDKIISEILQICKQYEGMSNQDLLDKFAHHIPEPCDVLQKATRLVPANKVPVPRDELQKLNGFLEGIKTLKEQQQQQAIAQALSQFLLIPHDYQLQGAREICSIITDPDKRTACKSMLVLPPGAGKTVVALLAAQALLSQHRGEACGVLVVAHSLEGAKNWESEIGRYVLQARVFRSASGGRADVKDCLDLACDCIDAGNHNVFVVVTPEAFLDEHRVSMLMSFADAYRTVTLVDEVHLKFKNPANQLGKMMAWYSSNWLGTERCMIFITATPCCKKEDSRLYLTGCLYSSGLPLKIRLDDHVAQAIESCTRVSPPVPKQVKDCLIYTVYTREPSIAEGDDRYDRYLKMRGLHGLRPEDVPGIMCLLVSVDNFLKRGVGVLVFLDNVKMINDLAAFIHGQDFKNFLFLHGDLPSQERLRVMDTVANSRDPWCLFVTNQIGGTGLNLVQQLPGGGTKLAFNVCMQLTECVYDEETLLQLAGRVARLPETNIRGLMFQFTNYTKECESARRIRENKVASRTVEMGSRRVQRRRVRRTEPVEDANEEAPPRRGCVMEISSAPAITWGLFMAAQEGTAIHSKQECKNCPYSVAVESPFQPAETMEAACLQVRDVLPRLRARISEQARAPLFVQPCPDAAVALPALQPLQFNPPVTMEALLIASQLSKSSRNSSVNSAGGSLPGSLKDATASMLFANIAGVLRQADSPPIEEGAV